MYNEYVRQTTPAKENVVLNKNITRSMLLDSFIEGRDIQLGCYNGCSPYYATGVILNMERESGGAGTVCHNFNVTIIDHYNNRHTTYIRTID